jgi:predicted house-cleaning NTP pyrophosphatase (Maf/HAM1 superfamily)
MAQRIRLASASSRRLKWLTANLYQLAEIEAFPLVGEEKSIDGEVSSQVSIILEDKITRARLQHHLEIQRSTQEGTPSPPNIWIVADTLVENPNDITSAFGQPEDEISALRMLLDISGGRHLVWSGTALIDFSFTEPVITRYVESAVVEFEELDDSVLSELISTGSWKGKAGAYDLAGKAKDHACLVIGEEVTVLGFANQAMVDLRKMLEQNSV